MNIKYHLQEQRQEIERSETWSAEFGRFDVIVRREANESIEISICSRGDDLMLGILRFSPKSVAALDSFADEAPELIRGAAAILREIGLDDLRSKRDRDRDEFNAAIRRQFAAEARP